MESSERRGSCPCGVWGLARGSFLDHQDRCALNLLLLGFHGGSIAPIVVVYPIVAQMVKSLPAIQETRVRSLGWDDPLVKEMATHSSNLAWKIPWVEEPGR